MIEAAPAVLADDGSSLVEGLAVAERALAEHRIVDAAAAMGQVADGCAALEAAGVSLSEPVRVRARQLHESCVAASEAIAGDLREQLQKAGVSRRAGDAYQPRSRGSK